MGDIFYTVPVSCIIVGCLLLAGFGISAYGVVEEQLIYIGLAFYSFKSKGNYYIGCVYGIFRQFSALKNLKNLND